MTIVYSPLQNVFKSKSFHELSDTALATLLTSDRIEIDELDVITAVREWATVNAVCDNGWEDVGYS